jgi:hypothetical protein
MGYDELLAKKVELGDLEFQNFLTTAIEGIESRGRLFGLPLEDFLSLSVLKSFVVESEGATL